MRHSAKLKVKLANLAFNYQLLQEHYSRQEPIFMVKANAYGHGLVPIVHYAYFELGIKNFGVACLGEAIELREKIPHGQFDLWVFSDLELESYWEDYLNLRLIPVLSQKRQLEFFLSQKNNHAPLVLKMETGMKRLGLELIDVLELLKKYQRPHIHHLMTHLCDCFDSKKGVEYKKQVENFEVIKSEFRGAGISIEQSSIANSAYLERKEGQRDSHIRPGLCLYGPASLTAKSSWQGKMISELEVQVLSLRKIEAGEGIGYGSWPSPFKGKCVLINMGYADGLPFQASGCKINIGDEQAQIIGRINMDMAYLLFSESSQVESGDILQLWTESNSSFVQLSGRMKTIPYALLTQLGSRLPREYLVG